MFTKFACTAAAGETACEPRLIGTIIPIVFLKGNSCKYRMNTPDLTGKISWLKEKKKQKIGI